MKDLFLTNRFKRDLKRAKKRELDTDRLDAIVTKLREGEELAPRYRDHALKGEWEDHRECHIAPDWLLIYQTDDDEVWLVRTGTHTDLFE